MKNQSMSKPVNKPGNQGMENQQSMAPAQELAPAPGRSVAVSAVKPPPMLSSDLIIPRILLMQGLSELVNQRKANQGDIVRSTTGEKLGHPDQLLDFIPLGHPVASWIIQSKLSREQKWRFQGTMPRNAGNNHFPWLYPATSKGEERPTGHPDATHEGRRVQAINLFALLPGDIEAELREREKASQGEMPDLSRALTPVWISFSSTSFKAGKEVMTFFSQAAAFGMAAWNYSLKLGCAIEKNDLGTFYVFKVDRTQPTPILAKFKPTVQGWSERVAQGLGSAAQIHEVEEEAPLPGVANNAF